MGPPGSPGWFNYETLCWKNRKLEVKKDQTSQAHRFEPVNAAILNQTDPV